jgi:hypothetical protein
MSYLFNHFHIGIFVHGHNIHNFFGLRGVTQGAGRFFRICGTFVHITEQTVISNDSTKIPHVTSLVLTSSIIISLSFTSLTWSNGGDHRGLGVAS